MLLYAKPQLVIQYAKARDACPNRSVHPQFWKATLAKFDVQLYGQHAPGQRVLVTAHDAGSLVQLTNADLMATHPDKPPRSIFTQRRLAAGVAPIREESRVVALNACGQSKVNVYFGFTSSQVIANNNSALAVVLRAQLISDDPNAAPVLAYSQQFTINARSQTKAEKDLGAARNLLEPPAGANARMAPNAPVAVATVVGPPPPSPPPPPGAAGPSQCAAPRGAHPLLSHVAARDEPRTDRDAWPRASALSQRRAASSSAAASSSGSAGSARARSAVNEGCREWTGGGG